MAPKRPKVSINYSPVPTADVIRNSIRRGIFSSKPIPTPTSSSSVSQRMLPRRPSLKQIWKDRFKQLIPFLCVFVYSAIGGVIFYHIEGSHARNEHNSIAAKNEHFKNETAYIICKNFQDDLEAKFINNETSDAYEMVGFVTDMLQKYATNLGLPSEDVTEWTFWGSVFFAATVCTSIGYGNMAPKTRLGQSITMLYAIFGIPLVLYTLSIIGKSFCVFIWDGYLFVRRLLFGWKKTKNIKTDITDFPIWLAILFTFGWILTCAALFCAWENWDYFTSIYFFFQSLTTIGFGDITPDKPRNMIFCFIFIVIGMGLVSMCWNLIQMKVEKFVGDLMAKIREKYVQSELNESLMDGEGGTDVEKEIEKISSQESTWLTSLMGKQQHNTLADEWRRKARLRNKFVQTDIEYVDKETEYVQEVMDADVQTVVPSSYFTPFRDVQTVPYKEYKRQPGYNRMGSSNDDFKHLLHDIAHIINDCRQTVSRDNSLSSISNLETESDKI